MFVKTYDNKIINLTLFQQLRVDGGTGMGGFHVEGLVVRDGPAVVVQITPKLSKQHQAVAVINDIFKSLKTSKTVLDLSDLKDDI